MCLSGEFSKNRNGVANVTSFYPHIAPGGHITPGMNLEDIASPFTWQYDSTIGFLNHLTYPNGMVRSNTYHPRLNLVTAIGYRKGVNGESVGHHEYDYDALMRPIQRRDFWDSSTTPEVRDFTYNDRSELVKDRIGRGESFSYQYDNIGNRKTARELEKEAAYESNPLNQYADIAGEGEDFNPVYDADGNEIEGLTSESRLYGPGSGMFSEAFDEEILGMKKGQTKEFTLEIPEDETAVLLAGQAGKPVTFEVTCNVVKKKELPEVTDEWAKETMGFEDVADMRSRIAQSIEVQKEGYLPRLKENNCLQVLMT